jgi:hypothetical protein
MIRGGGYVAAKWALNVDRMTARRPDLDPPIEATILAAVRSAPYLDAENGVSR